MSSILTGGTTIGFATLRKKGSLFLCVLIMNFLFDIDGTLTPHRQRINDSFRKFFASWCVKQFEQGNKVILVTGSDKQKTIEQIGLPLWRFVTGCYQNCGNQFYVRGKLVWESKWKMSASLHLDIITLIEQSRWYGTATDNIEERVGMVNISTIGRDCTQEERDDYYSWDKENLERLNIVKTLKADHPDIDLAIGGQISIDVYQKGKDKAQIIDQIKGENVFFGDQCGIEGNDYTIAMRSDKYHHVSDWVETYHILKTGGE